MSEGRMMITCLFKRDKNIAIVLLSIFYIIIAQQCKNIYIYVNVVSLHNEKTRIFLKTMKFETYLCLQHNVEFGSTTIALPG